MRRALFWIASGLLLAGCHTVPDADTDMGSDDVDATDSPDSGAPRECAPEERDWTAEPVFTFENSTVEINDLWTTGEFGYAVGWQTRLSTRKAVIWRMTPGRAVLEWERQDRDEVSFQAIDCIPTRDASPICVAVGRRQTGAVLQDGTWTGVDLGDGDWWDVVGTSAKFLAVNEETVVTGVVTFEDVMNAPALSRIGCADAFCVGAEGGVIYSTSDPTSWDMENNWEMPCDIDPDNCVATAIEVPTDGEAFIATDVGYVYRTTDAGETWQGVDSTVADVDFIDLTMLDAEHGWLVEAGGGLRRTEDGMSWSTVPVVTLGIPTARRAHLYDRDRAWVATEDGVWDIRFGCPP